ncbi:MAG: 5'-nucleotidase [Salibacteraceae bacterium]|jgi:5'-nucleotidase
MSKKPLILVTNDDGVTAKGIKSLIEIAKKYGDVVVVAPDKPQSAMGHAITINSILRVNEISKKDNVTTLSTSGTPVDCVKLAVNEILERKPDLVVSGINHGSNASINVIYSGTMSAAVEAAIEGIPAIGFSLLDFGHDADFEAAQHFADLIIPHVITNGLPNGVCLNVNIPKLPVTEIKGIKICHQANANWEEKFDKRTNPFGQNYYWLTGDFVNYEVGEDTDLWALDHGYVSIVPTQFDMTSHTSISHMTKLFTDVGER